MLNYWNLTSLWGLMSIMMIISNRVWRTLKIIVWKSLSLMVTAGIWLEIFGNSTTCFDHGNFRRNMMKIWWKFLHWFFTAGIRCKFVGNFCANSLPREWLKENAWNSFTNLDLGKVCWKTMVISREFFTKWRKQKFNGNSLTELDCDKDCWNDIRKTLKIPSQISPLEKVRWKTMVISREFFTKWKNAGNQWKFLHRTWSREWMLEYDVNFK